MTTPLKIDHMTLQDLPQVLDLLEQLGYHTTLDELRDRVQKIDQLPTHALFVARSSTRVALGFAHVHRETDSLLSAPGAELKALVVEQSCRSQGAGARLLDECERWARAQNLKSIRLSSNITRDDAHRFYTRHGFVTHKTSHTFTKTLT